MNSLGCCNHSPTSQERVVVVISSSMVVCQHPCTGGAKSAKAACHTRGDKCGVSAQEDIVVAAVPAVESASASPVAPACGKVAAASGGALESTSADADRAYQPDRLDYRDPLLLDARLSCTLI